MNCNILCSSIVKKYPLLFFSLFAPLPSLYLFLPLFSLFAPSPPSVSLSISLSFYLSLPLFSLPPTLPLSLFPSLSF